MRVSREISRLRALPRPASMLAEAYQSYRSDNLSNEYEEIEDLRRRLEQSRDMLTFQDLGSGMKRGLNEPDGANVSRTISEIMKSSAPVHECRLIAALTRQFKPDISVELGTCMGISAAYQLTSMKAVGSGYLYSVEGGRALADFARSNLSNLGLNQVEVVNAPFKHALPDILARVPQVNFAFIDGHHNGDATVNYFEILKPKLAPASIVVFDDLSWSPSMRKAWNRIAEDPRIICTSDLFAIGICILS